MSAVVKVGENEVIVSGLYIIPISTPYISIYIPEREFTFKISFEEKNKDQTSNEEYQRLVVKKASPNIADVIFAYKESETKFKSTRSPNRLFSYYRNEEGIRFKTRYLFNIDFSIDRKNSIELKIQITKSSEVIDNEGDDE